MSAKRPGLRARIEADPTVALLYREVDEGGEASWWMEPKPGFRNGYDDPCGGDGCLHGAHERTLTEIARRLPFTPCDCPDCALRLAR